jgi:hypothetical protein
MMTADHEERRRQSQAEGAHDPVYERGDARIHLIPKRVI